MRAILGFLAVLALLTTPVDAQSVWQPEQELAPREGAALTYDPARGKVLLFGGRTWIDGTLAIDLDDLFEWDGTTWTARLPQSRPPARAKAGLAFDPSTGGILLYGGVNLSDPSRVPTFFQDTWLYDGRDWRDVTPPITPPAVTLPALATDPTRSRVCTFVGNGNSVDVWEWDGVQWQVVPALNPPPRLLAMSAAYNALTGRISVFSYGTTTVWEWDGVGWHAVNPIGQRPPDMPNRRAAADPTGGGVAVFGGNVANPDGNVWYWSGSSWSVAGTFGSPRLWPENAGLAVGAFPGAELVLYVATRDTWTLDLGQNPAPFQRAWTLARPKGSASTSTYDGARDQFVILAHDATLGVQTWVHRDGEGYVSVPGPQPPTRFPIGFHPPSGQVVGVHTDRLTGNSTTWVFDGVGWAPRTVTPAPAAAPSCAVQTFYSYDPTSGMLLLYEQSNREMWGWDGQGWTLLQVATPQFPGACSSAFDASRNRLVLFSSHSATLTDIWEWDGSSWILANPSSGPLSQGVGNATYSPSLGGVVAVAGDPNSTTALYRWDGTFWTLVPGTLWRADMGNAGGGGLHYDPSRNRIIALGIFFDLRLEPYSFWRFQLPTLAADQVEPRIGETVTFRASLPGEANRLWLMGLSLSAWPGIPLRPAAPFGFERIPLTPDGLLAASLGAGLFGTLDAQGRGSLRITLPSNPALVGFRFHAAGLTLAPGPAPGEITSRIGLRIVQ